MSNQLVDFELHSNDFVWDMKDAFSYTNGRLFSTKKWY